MYLRTLRLFSFRTYAEEEITFAPKTNLLYGANGAGKTNVLEAVHYLCLTKSFLTATDTHTLRHDCPYFELEGVFKGERRASLTVKLVYVAGEGKRVFVNGAPLERLTEVVGLLPVVVLSPADYSLTAGGPEERRRFLNATLSQAHPLYLDDLLTYRRALKQRNALLQQVRRGQRLAPGTLAAWDEKLITLGARIVERRRSFLNQFAGLLSEAYRLLNAVGEEPSLTYQTVASLEDEPDADTIEERFRAQLARVERREMERGRTLIGPHLDEVVFRLGSFEVRPYASQGQHRTVSLALRLAMFLYLRDRLDETPLLLFDDVFGTLDKQRADTVLDVLQGPATGQSIVTAAQPDPFASRLTATSEKHRAFRVANGSITASDLMEPDPTEDASLSIGSPA